jgi:hypothetical protein
MTWRDIPPIECRAELKRFMGKEGHSSRNHKPSGSQLAPEARSPRVKVKNETLRLAAIE